MDSTVSDFLQQLTAVDLSKQWQLFLKDSSAFARAINWNEPLLLFIGCVHLAMFTALLVMLLLGAGLSRLALIFTVSAIMVLSAEPLNLISARHWKLIATQNYFDKNGMFLSVVWSLPQLILCFFILIALLYRTSVLLIRVKRRQLRMKQLDGKKKRI